MAHRERPVPPRRRLPDRVDPQATPPDAQDAPAPATASDLASLRDLITRAARAQGYDGSDPMPYWLGLHYPDISHADTLDELGATELAGIRDHALSVITTAAAENAVPQRAATAMATAAADGQPAAPEATAKDTAAPSADQATAPSRPGPDADRACADHGPACGSSGNHRYDRGRQR